MDSYIARQPIFSSDKKLYGYELLYRDNSKNMCPDGLDGDVTTQKVLSNALFTFDLDTLTRGRIAFINFTRQLLLTEVPLLLSPEHFAIEILEDVVLDAPVIAVLKKYKEAGFLLVLDDYIGTEIPPECLELLDIIKVDFRDTKRVQQRMIAQRVKQLKIGLLAEKIETCDDFTEAVSFGYTLFQGYYFSKPAVLKKNALSIATLSHVKLMKEVSKPDLDFRSIADIIHLDAALTWLLLKKMKTTEFYRGHTVSSIHLALVRLGIDEVRRWIMLLLLQSVLGQEMDALIHVGLIRAIFCECLSPSISPELQHIAFSAGMFSIIASLDDSFYEALDSLELSTSLKDALEGKNEIGHCLNLVRAYESGDWSLVPFLLEQYFPNLDSHDLYTMYMAAIRYADSTLLEKSLA